MTTPPATTADDESALLSFTCAPDLREEGDLIATVQRLSLARTLAQVQEIVRSAARRLTGADGATFILKDEDRCFYADEDAVEPLWKGRRFPMSACVSGWAMIHRRPLAIPDIYADDRVPHEAYRPTFVQSLAMVPIRRLDPVGAIGNYWASRHEPTDRELALLQALADSTAVALENVRVYAELEAARLESLQRLALAAEYRDDGTHAHTARVANTSFELALMIGRSEQEALRIGRAAQLHDVGKLAIPDAILLKRGRLDEDEFRKLQTHTTAGAEILGAGRSAVLAPAAKIALSHHERWDGTGYPSGRSGARIPLSGRIASVADVFDALTHARPYKRAWPVGDAVAELRALRGRQFDPDLIDAFLELDPARLADPPEVPDFLAATPGAAAAA